MKQESQYTWYPNPSTLIRITIARCRGAEPPRPATSATPPSPSSFPPTLESDSSETTTTPSTVTTTELSPEERAAAVQARAEAALSSMGATPLKATAPVVPRTNGVEIEPAASQQPLSASSSDDSSDLEPTAVEKFFFPPEEEMPDNLSLPVRCGLVGWVGVGRCINCNC
jgi:hypothetical protein